MKGISIWEAFQGAGKLCRGRVPAPFSAVSAVVCLAALQRRTQIQPQKIALVMRADRTGSGSFRTAEDVTAFQAHPTDPGISHEQPVLLHKLCEFSETVSVGFFNFRDHIEGRSHPGEAFFFGLVSEALINVVMFLVFIVLGGPQQPAGVLVIVYRITCVNDNGSAVQFFQMVVENFRVLLFLVGCKAEKPFQSFLEKSALNM